VRAAARQDFSIATTGVAVEKMRDLRAAVERQRLSTTYKMYPEMTPAPRTDHVQLDSRRRSAGGGHVDCAYADQVILQPPLAGKLVCGDESSHSRRAAAFGPEVGGWGVGGRRLLSAAQRHERDGVASARFRR